MQACCILITAGKENAGAWRCIAKRSKMGLEGLEAAQKQGQRRNFWGISGGIHENFFSKTPYRSTI
jgi:hypothetical protein